MAPEACPEPAEGIEILTKEALANAAVLIVRSPRGNTTLDFAGLAELGADPDLLIVQLAHGESLEVLSEIEMAQLGWVKKKKRRNEVRP